MAVDAFGLPREEIFFVAFAGWDVAGARWFGYPTFWVNRLDLPAEEPRTGRDLADLVRFVSASH
jgi:2-haloacid dehalogenase